MRVRMGVRPRTFAVIQMGTVTVLLAASILAYIYADLTEHGSMLGLLRRVDVGTEQSLPTYWSSFNLLLSAVLLYAVFVHERARELAGAGYWRALAVLFVLLSMDEIVGLHDNSGKILARLQARGTIPELMTSHHWIPLGIVVVVAVGVWLAPFVRALPNDTRWRFVVAGGVFLGGVLGWESVGAVMLATGFSESRGDILYNLRRFMEEGCEMYGIALFNCALYREILKRELSVVVESP